MLKNLQKHYLYKNNLTIRVKYVKLFLILLIYLIFQRNINHKNILNIKKLIKFLKKYKFIGKDIHNIYKNL